MARNRKSGLACRMEKALATDGNRQIYHRRDLGGNRKHGKNHHSHRAFDGVRDGNARNDAALSESNRRKLCKPGETFFDVGTGTGILAIAAAKFQVPSSKFQIAGCDTDEDAIKIAKENAELNETENIEFYVGSISSETPEFDFVCANLTADVIIPLLPLLVEKAKRIFVLSGILKEQENLIVEELKKFKIENPQIETDGEWISLTVGSGSGSRQLSFVVIFFDY